MSVIVLRSELENDGYSARSRSQIGVVLQREQRVHHGQSQPEGCGACAEAPRAVGSFLAPFFSPALLSRGSSTSRRGGCGVGPVGVWLVDVLDADGRVVVEQDRMRRSSSTSSQLRGSARGRFTYPSSSSKYFRITGLRHERSPVIRAILSQFWVCG